MCELSVYAGLDYCGSSFHPIAVCFFMWIVACVLWLLVGHSMSCGDVGTPVELFPLRSSDWAASVLAGLNLCFASRSMCRAADCVSPASMLSVCALRVRVLFPAPAHCVAGCRLHCSNDHTCSHAVCNLSSAYKSSCSVSC